jgi:CRISPR-associated protein Cmr4
MKYTFNAYFIQCITNMHVGSGDANYGVIDKLVQRDPVTGYPTIHPSSLKGALREHFEQQWIHPEFDFNKLDCPLSKVLELVAKEYSKKESERSFEFLKKYINDKSNVQQALQSIKNIELLFGKEDIGGTGSETGRCKFLGADMVSLPVRFNFEQYVLGVNKAQIELLNSKAELLTSKKVFKAADAANKLFFKVNEPGYKLYAEDIEIEDSNKLAHVSLLNCTTNLNCFDQKYATFDNGAFKAIGENLPVIARNCIEDGTSANLWYEQVVPHQSVFLTFIGMANTLKPEFEKVLAESIVQIGGNATIGYGLCKFYKITL